MKRYVWMLVTKDKYELPLLVADSSRELAELAGVAHQTVLESTSRARRLKSKCKYIVIQIDDEESED